MKKVNGIRIFFILTALFLIGCYQAVHWKNLPGQQEIAQTEQIMPERETEAAETKQALPVSRTVDYKYVIVEEGDYLTVYFADRTTVYEYTDIRYSDLEEPLRRKIRRGYCISDEKTLFGFLENYSS